MIKKLFYNLSFISGVILLLIIISTSIINTQYYDQNTMGTPQKESEYDKPAPPSLEHLFGTNEGGEDMFDRILRKTVPTLKMAIFVTIGRMGIGILIGSLYGMFQNLKSIDILIEGFNFVPSTLLAFIILNGLHFVDFKFFMENPDFRWNFTAYTLIIVGIPSLMQLVGKETRLVLQNEFITSSKVLGGRRFHILSKHVIPSVRGRLVLLFNSQLISVLTLMMHVSILGFFISGWTDTIGKNYFELILSPWLVFFPVLLFALLIISITLISGGIRAIYEGEYLRRKASNF
ncbi:ABC transporter permease subunit [Bacillus sp. BHET2]|uniref:ABC transporter permease subunit n=1 Tax=Bacillus sp. BHET2 TaxID=2583818 RepID=UPI00110E98CE|nr:ABC transporter permease subunit [Bacillus sp. BHET2]TMU86577.1 ABC transporter permease subunit [Bacillus sp. BHET2]